MITSAVILDALADGRPQDTPLTPITLEPALLIPANASLKEALAQMKRAHEYKILIPDGDGAINHVLTQEEISATLPANKASAIL